MSTCELIGHDWQAMKAYGKCYMQCSCCLETRNIQTEEDVTMFTVNGLPRIHVRSIKDEHDFMNRLRILREQSK